VRLARKCALAALAALALTNVRPMRSVTRMAICFMPVKTRACLRCFRVNLSSRVVESVLDDRLGPLSNDAPRGCRTDGTRLSGPLCGMAAASPVSVDGGGPAETSHRRRAADRAVAGAPGSALTGSGRVVRRISGQKPSPLLAGDRAKAKASAGRRSPRDLRVDADSLPVHRMSPLPVKGDSVDRRAPVLRQIDHAHRRAAAS
jgi:hypothetical protein